MKLGLHRSITFWSGILMMAFIGWAWRDSLSHGSWAELGWSRAAHCWGGLYVGHHANSLPVNFDADRELLGSDPPVVVEVFPAPVFLRHGEMSLEEMGAMNDRVERGEIPFTVDVLLKFTTVYGHQDYWVLFVPHWLVMAGLVVVWVGLLVWRGRRRKKKWIDPS